MEMYFKHNEEVYQIKSGIVCQGGKKINNPVEITTSI